LSAEDRAKGPITVEVAGGEYAMHEPLVLTPTDGGTAGAPIIYRARSGERPVFSGGRRIRGFSATTSGVWTVQIPEAASGEWRFEQLFVNGRRATRARSPDDGYFLMQGVEETVLTAGDRVPDKARQVVLMRPEEFAIMNELDPRELADGQLVAFHKWDNTRRFIERLDGDRNAIVTHGRGMKPWNPWKKDTRFILENFAGALTAPGEWFLDRAGRLSYMPHEGEALASAEIVAPVTDKFIVVQGRPEAGEFVEHMRFEGLEFRYAGYKMPPEGFEPAQAAATIDAVVMLDGARHVEFVGCAFEHFGRYGIWFRRGCRDCLVQHTMVGDMGAGGVASRPSC
jgi:hypothetical protein